MFTGAKIYCIYDIYKLWHVVVHKCLAWLSAYRKGWLRRALLASAAFKQA